MKVTDHIAAANGKTLFSFEVLPPLKGNTIDSLFGTIERLMQFDPKFIDVTSHREEYIFKKHDSGLLQKVHTRKRPGTVGICAAIQNKFRIDTVPHIICGGFSREETEYALIDLHYLGIDNVLVLRGDALRSEGSLCPNPRATPTPSTSCAKSRTSIGASTYTMKFKTPIRATSASGPPAIPRSTLRHRA